ncbi:MAG: bacteriocin [Pirellula sp.]|nr:bacteriocin [Pirellula sp.]
MQNIRSLVALVFPLAAFASAACSSEGVVAQAPGKTPAVGDAAPDFRLPTPNGQVVQLSELAKAGPVVVVVLRGFPGYQCPACNAQTGQFFAAAEKFQMSKAQVVFVYPGQQSGLARRAGEFLQGKMIPAGMHVVLDPDYSLTNLYGLRWDAVRETAYPATIVVDKAGTVRFIEVSKSHGNRISADKAIEAVSKL